MWASSDANGASARELTSGRVASAATTANLSTSADTTVTITLSPGAESLANEYLFINLGIEVTAAGSGNTQDVDFRVGSAYTLTTPNFSPSITVNLTGIALPIVAGNLTYYSPDVTVNLTGEVLPIAAGTLTPEITYLWKKYYFKDALAPDSTAHRSLQDGGTPPSNAASGTGWTADSNAANQYCIQNGNVEIPQADSQWGTTQQPTANAPSSIGDAWRSEYPLTGSFAAGNWPIYVGLLSQTNNYMGTVSIRYRVWKSSNPDGTGGTELAPTGNKQGGTTYSPLGTNIANMQSSAGTWTPTAPLVFNNEYLFLQLALRVVTAGNAADQDVLIGINQLYSYVRTTDFTAGSDVTVDLTGQTLPIAAGTLAPVFDLTMAGLSLPIAAGTLTYQLVTDITLNLNGISLGIVAGNLSPTFDSTLAGAALPAVAGTLAPQISKTLTGVANAFASGLLSPQFDVSLVGAALPTTAGNLAPAFTVVLAGQALPIVTGTIVYQDQGSGNITLNMTGIALPVVAGALAPLITINLSGIVFPAVPGTLAPQFNKTLLGIAAPISPGTLAPQFNKTLVGQSLPAVAGALGPAFSFTLNGAVLPLVLGTLVPQISRTLVGQSVAITCGNLSPAATVALTGIVLAIATGTLTYQAGQNITLNLSGQTLPIVAGTLAPSVALTLQGQPLAVTAGQLIYALTRTLQGIPLTVAQGQLLAEHGIAITGTALPIAAGALSPGITITLTGQVMQSVTGQLIVQGLLAINPNYIIHATEEGHSVTLNVRDTTVEDGSTQDKVLKGSQRTEVITSTKRNRTIQ